jgi:hypothetical protein
MSKYGTFVYPFLIKLVAIMNHVEKKLIMFYRCGRGSTLCVVFYISLNLNQNLYQGNKMEEISNFNE